MSPSLQNRLPVAADTAAAPAAHPAIAKLKEHEPTLAALAEEIAALDPSFARHLCETGLAGMTDSAERAAWEKKLAGFLEEDGLFAA